MKMKMKKTLLTYYNSDLPFVIEEDGKYFITNVKGYDKTTEYTDDPEILLNAIKNVDPINYQDMFTYNAKTKEEYWQLYFNYEYNGGGLIMWQNPTESWNSELARRGKLLCPKCGDKMIMYYKPICTKCEKPEKDKKGRIMLIPACYYVEKKNNLPHRTIWQTISDNEFFEHNDTSCDLYFTGDEDVDKYIRMIDEEFPIEITNFFVSW
jgi:hypothetical protein